MAHYLGQVGGSPIPEEAERVDADRAKCVGCANCVPVCPLAGWPASEE